MLDRRKVEVLRNDNLEEILFEQLKEGDIFQLTEPTGEKVLNEKGTVFNKATSEPFLHNGIWTIKAAPLELVVKP